MQVRSKSPVGTHFLRYCAVGGVATALHFIVLVVLVESFTVNATVASAVGFCLAVILNYFLQYYWTFASSGSHKGKFPLFAAFAVAALTVNVGIFWTCNEVFGLPYLISQALATGAVVTINFHLNRRFVFGT